MQEENDVHYLEHLLEDEQETIKAFAAKHPDIWIFQKLLERSLRK